MKAKKVKIAWKVIYGLGGALTAGGVAAGTTLGVLYSQEVKESPITQVSNGEPKKQSNIWDRLKGSNWGADLNDAHRNRLNIRITDLDKLARSLPNSRGYQRTTKVVE